MEHQEWFTASEAAEFLVLSKTRIASGMLIVACIAGFIAASLFWILPGVLLFMAALLAFLGWLFGRKQTPSMKPSLD